MVANLDGFYLAEVLLCRTKAGARFLCKTTIRSSSEPIKYTAAKVFLAIFELPSGNPKPFEENIFFG